MGAFGAYHFPHLPFQHLGAGINTDVGAILPPGANVHFVRSTGKADYDPPELTGRILTTINEALGQCRSGRGDHVILLPGHSETYGDSGDVWSNLVAGTKIISWGEADERATFTFNHANAQIDWDVANVSVRNVIFKCAGPSGTTALTVANPFNVTASGGTLAGCELEVGIDADQLCTDAIKLAAGADNFKLIGCDIYGALAAEITSVVTTTGAVDRLKIIGNHIDAAVATAATGVLLDLDNAAIIENQILHNHLRNKTASSKFVIDPHASSTGFVDGNRYYVNDGATGPASLGWATFTTAYRFGVNYCVTADGASAILCPAADT